MRSLDVEQVGIEVRYLYVGVDDKWCMRGVGDDFSLDALAPVLELLDEVASGG